MDWKEWQRYTSKHGSKRYRIPLNFGEYTSIQPIPNSDFPEHYFNFIAYNEVQSKADVSGATLTDYIGCIHRISDPHRTSDATRKPSDTANN
nr:nucleic acid-binding, OB-fold protein [Tanacetum cinerariifolium]